MRKALVVVDVQNDFVTGSLGSEAAQNIIPAVIEKIQAAHDAGYIVIATMDTHGDDYMDTLEGRRLPVPHCIYGTNGWFVVPEVWDALDDEDLVLEKVTFGSEDLPELLKELAREDGFDEIEVCGLCTDICVMANVALIRTAFPNVVIKVDAAACAGVTTESHNAALAVMNSLQVDTLNR